MTNDSSTTHDPNSGNSREPVDRTAKSKRRWPLHTRIMVGLLVGALLGIPAHIYFARPNGLDSVDALDKNRNGVDDRLDGLADNIVRPIGSIFLRLVLMVVVPLVVAALSLGVVGLGDVRHLGRVGLRMLLYTALLSGTAVVIGITLVNTIRPAAALSAEKRDQLSRQYAGSAERTTAQAAGAKGLKDILLDIIPQNPLQEMVGALDGSSPGNGMLSVMFFSVAMGVALIAVGERGQTLVKLLEGTFDVCMVIIGFAMRLAPYGVACLVFAITAQLGLEIVVTLFWFVLTVLLGLGLHLLVVYSLFVRIEGGRSPLAFFRDVSEAMLMAFGTSSSNATLPTALRVAEEKLHLPPQIARFVLTIGSTGNQNGTALYEGVVVLFLAEVYGLQLSIVQQMTVVLMSVLAGVGTAGVPGGSIPMIIVVLQSVGVSGESIAIILGVDRILDMCRTVLNVTGDLALATCVARG